MLWDGTSPIAAFVKKQNLLNRFEFDFYYEKSENWEEIKRKFVLLQYAVTYVEMKN